MSHSVRIMRPRLGVLLVLAVVVSVVALTPSGARGKAASRTVAFTANYTGMITLGIGSPLAHRHATGRATLLGTSTLALADRNTHLPLNDTQTQCVAGEGDGTLSAQAGDRVAVLFVFSGNLFGRTAGSCPLPVGVASGYYIIFGGTGTFAGATGSGMFREVQPTLVRPGLPAPITDTFKGTLTLAG